MTKTSSHISPTSGLKSPGSPDQFTPTGAEQAQRALDEHGVVVYRELGIDDDELLEFGRMLGTLVVQSTGEHRHPEIQTITLDPAKTNALLASYRQGNFHWHIDGATEDVPQKGTLLTAREVDPAGGDTEFANTYAAYAALLRRGQGGARDSAGRAQLCLTRSRWPIPDAVRRGTRIVGPGADPGAPARVDPAQRAQVTPARCDRGRGRRLARR